MVAYRNDGEHSLETIIISEAYNGDLLENGLDGADEIIDGHSYLNPSERKLDLDNAFSSYFNREEPKVSLSSSDGDIYFGFADHNRFASFAVYELKSLEEDEEDETIRRYYFKI